jgi:hypothetical protein
MAQSGHPTRAKQCPLSGFANAITAGAIIDAIVHVTGNS